MKGKRFSTFYPLAFQITEVKKVITMFNVVFWILAIWFIVNVIWMWFRVNDQKLQKTFAWINCLAIVIGFWVYYGVTHDANSLANWFICLNWANVILAIIQFYLGYRHNNAGHTAGHTAFHGN